MLSPSPAFIAGMEAGEAFLNTDQFPQALIDRLSE